MSTELPAKVGVIGGGRMGIGIAHAFLLRGCEAIVVERDSAAATSAQQRLERLLLKSVERGDLSNFDVALERAMFSVSTGELGDCDLVVEAVPEDFDLKVETLVSAEGVLKDSAYLATNTSSLSVDALAERLSAPQRFIGLHFFNPVPASALIEIVVGDKTDPGLVDKAKAWTQGLEKTPVVVTDSPGFASSRLGVCIALEAMRMVEEGVASARDIDAAMELGYKHPSGPLKTTDIVGLDVRLHIAEYLAAELGERFTPPQILRDKVAAGELGRKSGKGFYDW
ncbi:3-hydroxyacyl-CoA dehydrogenase family protein [Gephyromycinifex aptenodytis]|uniref:3-hydroxyacyl-CoA dehydrogenase family protein n=1 Tax=Gephyromycinifex aptenodytis TaxID=2716227 RepID=UPI00144807B4|nr:3-hydroxyacyl-CoA dehydrogenase family protein [Gephyromycinifex aptenodytis]